MRGLAFASVLLLPLISLGLKALGYRRVSVVLETLSPHPFKAALNEERARATAQAVAAAAARGPYHANCLERSLLVWWMLRWQGIPSRLKIGVRREGQTLKAHAWIEHGGNVINDQDDIAAWYTPYEGGTTPEEVTRLV